MFRTLYINGKFTAQRLTGVQRVGWEIVRALDRLAGQGAGWPGRAVLLCPPGARPPSLVHIEVRTTPGRRLPLHLWEQTVLPWQTRGGLLLNLSGSGPWFVRRQVAVQHDAAVFDHPQAYTPAFVAWYRRLFRRQARHAHVLFTVSEFSRARLAARLDLPPQRWQVLPLAADHMLRVDADEGVLERLGLKDRPFFLAVASANPTKGLELLRRAYDRLAASGRPALVLVGGRNERVFAAGPDDSDPVGLLRAGVLDDAALRSLYARALALVFPSTYEGFGLPPLEAMSLGCPVLTTTFASIPEVCGDAAAYIEPLSDETLTALLERMARDAAWRERLRRAGLQRAQVCAWDDTAHALLQALHDEAQST